MHVARMAGELVFRGWVRVFAVYQFDEVGKAMRGLTPGREVLVGTHLRLTGSKPAKVSIDMRPVVPCAVEAHTS